MRKRAIKKTGEKIQMIPQNLVPIEKNVTLTQQHTQRDPPRANTVDKDHLSKNLWLYHYMAPDRFPSQRMPDYVAFPSYVFRHRLERVSKILTGVSDYLALWAPLNSIQYHDFPSTTSPYANAYFCCTDGTALSGTTPGPTLDAAQNDGFLFNGIVNAAASILPVGSYMTPTTAYNAIAFPSYLTSFTGSSTERSFWAFIACSVSGTVSIPRFGISPTSALTAIDKSNLFTNFTTTRLVSGYLKIVTTSASLTSTGTLKIGMTLYTPFNTPRTLNGLTRLTLNNSSVYKMFKADQPVIIYYRIVDEGHTRYGPYVAQNDLAPKLPVYIIDASGLPPDMQIIVESTRYVEGIPIQSLVDLLNPGIENDDQNDVKFQFNSIQASPADAIMAIGEQSGNDRMRTNLTNILSKL